MDFLEYINSYGCCAINGVEKWQFEELREKYPFVFNNLHGQHYDRNIRFENGVCASFCCIPYHCGDMFHCQAVIPFDDICFDDDAKEDNLDISCLM